MIRQVKLLNARRACFRSAVCIAASPTAVSLLFRQQNIWEDSLQAAVGSSSASVSWRILRPLCALHVTCTCGDGDTNVLCMCLLAMTVTQESRCAIIGDKETAMHKHHLQVCRPHCDNLDRTDFSSGLQSIQGDGNCN